MAIIKDVLLTQEEADKKSKESLDNILNGKAELYSIEEARKMNIDFIKEYSETQII